MDSLLSHVDRIACLFETSSARVWLSGGEPLLIRELERVIKALKSHGLRIILNTNGTLLTPERARSLSASGLDGVLISVDSLDAETHNALRGKHALTMKNLERLLGRKTELGFKIGIASVLGERNVDSVGDLLNWAIQHGVDYYSSNVVWGGLTEQLADKGAMLREGALRFIGMLRDHRHEIQIPSPAYLHRVEAALTGKPPEDARLADCQTGKTFFYVTTTGEILSRLNGSHENEGTYRACDIDFPACLTYRCLCLFELFYGGI